MTRNLALALAALGLFTAYTIYVATQEGPLGALELVRAHGWGLQMLLDIGISLVIASFWIVPDARKRGINPWPYLAASAVIGSIAALGYVVHRELRPAKA